MSNYTKTTDFEAKDSLPSGDSGKIIKGAEFETEFDAISTAIATKADADGATLTGTTSFETLSDGTISVTAFADEDDMVSDSATLVPTQQSVKAYVDSQVTAQDLDFQADSGGALSIDLDSEALTLTGGTGIDTSGALNEVTFAIDSTVATLTGTQTLTNKTLTSPDVNAPDIDGGTIDGTVIGGTTPAAVSATTVSATGNITVDGTVDGRDVATDGAKLDGIEASATADQTDAEIRAAVEAATDSNVFTDADHTKLDGIEASADVTDTANVTAAGALMDSELTDITAVKALNQGVATTDSPTFAGLTTTADVSFGDNDKAIFGAGSDLQIYHSGSGSFVDEQGTGSLYIRATNLFLRSSSGEEYLKGVENGAVTAYYNNSPKLATTNTGIDVTGTAVTDGVTVDGNILLNNEGNELQFNTSSTPVNKIYTDDTYTSNGLTISADNGVALKSVNNYLLLDDTGTNEMVLNVDSGERMRVTSTGIDVTGSISADGLTVSTSGTNAEAYFDNGAQSYRLLNRSSDNAFSIFDDSSSAFRLTTASNGDISFYEDTGTTAKLFWDASAESLGIGTSSPASGFELEGVGNATNVTLDNTTASTGRSYSIRSGNTGNLDFYDNDATNARVTIDSSGNVGIGTSSPSKKLSIKSDGGGSQLGIDIHNEGTATGDDAVISFETQGHHDFTIGIDRSTSSFVFAKSSTLGSNQRLVIDNSGNLLVGKTSSSFNTAGIQLQSNGELYATRAGGTVVSINRKTDDGAIVNFAKDGTTVGSIGTLSSKIYVGSDDTSLFFDSLRDALVPHDASTNAARGSAIDLGRDVVKFKDLYLSGDVNLANNSQITFASTSCNIEGNSAGADFIKFTTGNNEAARFDSSGNLLVGKTAVGLSSTGFQALASGNQSAFVSDGDRALILNRQTSDGSVLEFRKDGTTVGSIASVGGADIKVSFSSDGDQYITGNAASNYLTFSSANAERMRLDSSGNLLIHKTISGASTAGAAFVPNNYLSVANTQTGSTARLLLLNRHSGTGTAVEFRQANAGVGTISVTASATAYNTSSDQRLKDNIVDAPSASDDIDAIQVRSFDWKADGSHQKYGMVAQELQSVAPEAVSVGETEENMMGVDYSKLVPMLVKEIQSLRARVAQLETN